MKHQPIMNYITACKKMQEALRSADDQLGLGVRERTGELRAVNAKLLQEIAKRKRAEEELRRTEERFRTVFETPQDCIFVKDLNLEYTRVNPATLGLLGLSSDIIIGKTGTKQFRWQVLKDLGNVELCVMRGQGIGAEHSLPVHTGSLIVN